MPPFYSETNPNEAIGGGGCLCHPIKSVDTQGPFFVFPETETDSNLSPHAVACARCIRECAAKLNGEPQGAAGERDTVTPIEDIAL